MIMTHRMRHIFMPINQTNEIIHLMLQFVKQNISIPFNKMWLLQTKENLFD